VAGTGVPLIVNWTLPPLSVIAVITLSVESRPSADLILTRLPTEKPQFSTVISLVVVILASASPSAISKPPPSNDIFFLVLVASIAEIEWRAIFGFSNVISILRPPNAKTGHNLSLSHHLNKPAFNGVVNLLKL